MIDVLTVTFDKDDTNRDLSAMCVAERDKDGKFYVRNMLVGDKAERAYEILTEVGNTETESDKGIRQNPMEQTLDIFKHLYLENKDEVDRVAQEYMASMEVENEDSN